MNIKLLIIVLAIPTLLDAQSTIYIIDLQLDSLQKERIELNKGIQLIENEIKLLNAKKIIAIKDQEFARGVSLFTKQDVKIYLERASYSKVTGTLAKNTMIMAYDKALGYYMIEHDSLMGFVSFMDVETLDQRSERAEEDKLRTGRIALAQKRSLEQKQEDEAKRQKRREQLTDKYGETLAQRIINGEIWLGMTAQMVIDSWGYPAKNNKSVGSWGVNEQWIFPSAYLYLKNGILNSWQTKS